MSPVPIVINADDFGLTEGVCTGIVRAVETGVVTSTTAMVCVPGAVQRLQSWAPRIIGKIGAHLQLTNGVPILPAKSVPSLVAKDGAFPSRRKAIRGAGTAEVLAEWAAQIETLIRAGIEPTHLDSHHHVHGLPNVFPAFCELAQRYSLPVRSLSSEMARKLRAESVPFIDRTLTDWYGAKLTVASFMHVLQQGFREYPESKNFEIMCHPGLIDKSLPSLSRYVTERESELAILCDPNLKREIENAGFECREFGSAFCSVTWNMSSSSVTSISIR